MTNGMKVITNKANHKVALQTIGDVRKAVEYTEGKFDWGSMSRPKNVIKVTEFYKDGSSSTGLVDKRGDYSCIFDQNKKGKITACNNYDTGLGYVVTGGDVKVWQTLTQFADRDFPAFISTDKK